MAMVVFYFWWRDEVVVENSEEATLQCKKLYNFLKKLANNTPLRLSFDDKANYHFVPTLTFIQK